MLIAVAVAAPLALSATVNPGLASTTVNGGGVRNAPTVADMLDECTGLTSWPQAPDAEVGWIGDQDGQSVFSWRISPPTSGNFAPVPWTGERFVPVDADRHPNPAELLALEYRGWTTVWYLPTAPKATLAPLMKEAAAMVAANPALVIAPWGGDAKTTWPRQRSFVYSTWNQTLSCGTFSQQSYQEFLAALPTAPGEALSLTEPGPEASVRSHDVLGH
jgi:hypothetical protein